MPKITARTIDTTTPKGTDVLVFDDDIPGFALKVTPKGARILLFQYWSPVERGKRRRVTIGRLGDSLLRPDGSVVALTIHSARKEAERLRGLVLDRRDPYLDRVIQARSIAERESAMSALRQSKRSFQHVARQFLEDANTLVRTKTTAREYRRLLERHLVSATVQPGVVLGDRPISEVSRADADAVRRQQYQRTARRAGEDDTTQRLQDRPILANRVQQLGRAILNYAERIGARPEGLSNPFAGDRWYKEFETRQPLTRTEIAAVHRSLREEEQEHPSEAVDVIRLLLFTGMRKQEALSLRWDAVDRESATVVLGVTKTGPSRRPLSAQAIAVLDSIPRRGPYVFPSPRDANVPRSEIKRTWLRVRARAGVSKPLHALRHTLASVALSEGVPLAAVGAILGHRDSATTARYAKMENTAAKSAADVAGDALVRDASASVLNDLAAEHVARSDA